MNIFKSLIGNFFIIFFIFSLNSYCQNRKEQIYLLEKANDSLQTEINREKTKHDVLSYNFNSILDSIYKDSITIENKIKTLKFQDNYIDNEIIKSKNSVSTFKKLCGISSDDENIQVLSFGKNTLTGTVILKNFVDIIFGTPILNEIVLKLDKKVRFKADEEVSEDKITDEIAIYGDFQKSPYISPNIKYKTLINKRVIITADIVPSLTGHYPLEANIIKDFTYKLD